MASTQAVRQAAASAESLLRELSSPVAQSPKALSLGTEQEAHGSSMTVLIEMVASHALPAPELPGQVEGAAILVQKFERQQTHARLPAPSAPKQRGNEPAVSSHHSLGSILTLKPGLSQRLSAGAVRRRAQHPQRTGSCKLCLHPLYSMVGIQHVAIRLCFFMASVSSWRACSGRMSHGQNSFRGIL